MPPKVAISGLTVNFPAPEPGEAPVCAVDDLSLDVALNEFVCVVGPSGCGKSTLLKALSRITEPSEGIAEIEGTVGSLLEVGTGFHDELTGRENVYLNGSIIGMKKCEVDRHFDAIVEFSGVEQFIDTPIKRYSSGMRLRLGFAVAAHLDPDVLVVDEVLAVGDASFQKKCIKAMDGLRTSGRTVFFVSHGLAAVENLCSRGIWIDAGKVRMDGGAREVIAGYMGSFAGEQASGADLSTMKNRLGSGEVRYTRLEYLNSDGTPCAMTRSGDSLVLRFHYHVEQTIRDPSFGFKLFSEMGTLITECGHWMHGIRISKLDPGDGYLDLKIEALNLLPGRYQFSLWITASDGMPVYDGDVRTSLEIEAADVYRSGRILNSRYGIVYFPQRWKVTQQ